MRRPEPSPARRRAAGREQGAGQRSAFDWLRASSPGLVVSGRLLAVCQTPLADCRELHGTVEKDGTGLRVITLSEIQPAFKAS